MSSESLPITPARFAEAIKDLSLASLHLKVLELRNSIAHLDYSNEQLRPFAEGTEAALGSQPGEPPRPDQDCIDAIKENEVVIGRMLERIALVRAEVEGRGCSWTEFEAPPPQEQQQSEHTAGAAGEGAAVGVEEAPAAVNGHPAAVQQQQQQQQARSGESGGLSGAWRDGTIQTGVIRNGQVIMDDTPSSSSSRPGGGGSLTDEQLRRALEERMGLPLEGDEDEGGGLHL